MKKIFNNQVICNAIGSVPHLCKGCGAASPHHLTSCEPCPVNENAHCVEIATCSFCDGYGTEKPHFTETTLPCIVCSGLGYLRPA